jgi:hypothetical protein
VSYLDGLSRVLHTMREDWSALLPRVPHLDGDGTVTADPQQLLLDVIGLHSSSVQWWQRYAEATPTLTRRTPVRGPDHPLLDGIIFDAKAAARTLLGRLGYAGPATPTRARPRLHRRLEPADRAGGGRPPAVGDARSCATTPTTTATT